MFGLVYTDWRTEPFVIRKPYALLQSWLQYAAGDC
jgi:hypothetical protein